MNRDAEQYDEIVEGVPEGIIKTYGIDAKTKGDVPCVLLSPTLRTQGTSPFVLSPCHNLDYVASDVRLAKEAGIIKEEFFCKAPSWEREMRVNIPGLHNVENALGAICIADHYGIDPVFIAEGLLDTVSPEGRMERVEVPAPYTVFIDYAHNKLSMEIMMETAKLFEPNRILCVFGLDGDRAHVRRKDCGEILGRDADYTILSDTSPRTDDPEKILHDVAENIESCGGAGKYEILHDRHESIPKLLGMAREGDVVLIIGTGDRREMEINGQRTPINEHEIINRYFDNERRGR